MCISYMWCIQWWKRYFYLFSLLIIGFHALFIIYIMFTENRNKLVSMSISFPICVCSNCFSYYDVSVWVLLVCVLHLFSSALPHSVCVRITFLHEGVTTCAPLCTREPRSFVSQDTSISQAESVWRTCREGNSPSSDLFMAARSGYRTALCHVSVWWSSVCIGVPHRMFSSIMKSELWCMSDASERMKMYKWRNK